MFDEKSYSLKMDKAIEVFSKELSSLRTGRANAAMLDLIKVDVYGQQMPINQVGSITTPEPRMINIQIWDTNNVSLVDAAIKKSDLGLNPQIDGQLIRLPVPELNEERRIELKKIIKSVGEKCKVSIRNIRREANEDLKKLLKLKEISEDVEKTHEKKVQTITDNHIKSVDEKVLVKEKANNVRNLILFFIEDLIIFSTVLRPALCPAFLEFLCFKPHLPLPSIIMATCFNGFISSLFLFLLLKLFNNSLIYKI